MTEKIERENRFTNSPNDLLYMLNVHWGGALEEYKGNILYSFLSLIPDILEEFRRKILLDLEKYYMKASTKYLIAHVNNSIKIAEEVNRKREELT
eukprot:UN04803